MTEDDDDRLDAGRDDDGDEFVFVDETTAAADATSDVEPDRADATSDVEPDRADTTSDAEPDRADPSDEAPLADLAAEMRKRGGRSQSDDDLFETVEVGDIDAEAVWADLEDDTPPDVSPESPLSDSGAAAVDAAGEESVVPKRSYCQRCRYFTDPPEVGCTHEGTEIVELVDAAHFRVRGCPMVGEDGPELSEFE